MPGSAYHTVELTKTNRIASIDILRGAVMIIMALDHTRDFFHQPAMIADPLNTASTTIPIYFTRWITHFCAPVFVFLSGISAYLSSLKKTKSEASKFLVKRGLFLVFIEVTVITFGITFNPLFNFIIFQVIWAIGWSMIILGILSWISHYVVLVAGIVLFFGHNILDFITLEQTGASGVLWKLFFRASGTVFPLTKDGSYAIGDFYAILPWTGVMLMGYSIAYWFKNDFPAAKRKKLLQMSGISLIVLFIFLRYTGLYGNPGSWQREEGFDDFLSFLNTSKYPPSLQYLAMTLGPACILLSLLENVTAKWCQAISVYGKAPLFYYILHFYLIHFILIILFFATGHSSGDIFDERLPFLFRPLTFGFGLPVVYLIWLIIVVSLYWPCKWFIDYKREGNQWWLAYI
jgi:uncharacterized membrane protein